MQQESKHTKSKVIAGYTLLFLLSILSTILIYKQITRLIVNEETMSEANRKLFIVSNTVSSLYEAEAFSNAFIQTGSQSQLRRYLNLMANTEDNIDTLRKYTTRIEQQLRLDTIGNLLEDKVRNLQDLAYVKKSFIPEEFYEKAIAHIESDRDSLQEEVNVVKRYVTTVDSSYIKTEKKKRRWIFSKALPDSVLKVSTRHHIIVDTLDQSVRNTDTVVNILRSTWQDVQKQKETINQKINQKEYALINQSANITDQLKRIISAYEKEEINNAYLKQQNREQAITTMIRTFAWVAVVAFLSVLFFTFFILRDLSRSQRYRRQLETANQYTDQLLKSREKMILTVTHDIKSPLSSVIGYIELLNNTPITDRQRYFLKNMQGSSQHILKMIGNLLDLSKLENNKMPVEEVVFNPAQLFQEITDNFMPLATAKQLTLISKSGNDLNGDFKGDALRIRQIITNILSNAVKYTSQGHIRFTATRTTDDKQVILKIEDTGSGMTEEEQKLIFEEFTRLKSHSTIEGTGLGLTITLKLIHLLQGKIKLESEPDKGSCFTIYLPLQSAASPQPPHPAPGQAASLQLPDLKVLLVDDDPLQLEMTASLLENHGIHSTLTTHPEEVVARLQSEQYDLIFSDIQMPGMNGFELVKQIRELPDCSPENLPVVALSADSDKQETDYIQAGFTAYLAKPFTSGQLIQLIARLTHQQVQPIPSENTAENDELSNTTGYNLKNILQFTDNDRTAFLKIITSFTTTTREHLDLLRDYQTQQQTEGITRLAHKMLPMFRQIEAQNIVQLLEKLEHPEKQAVSSRQLFAMTATVITDIQKLMDNLASVLQSYSME